MLRITIHNEAQVTSFVIEGKLVGPWVEELEKCWKSALAADPSKAMLVNLAAVTFIDSAGRALLAGMRRQGARLLSSGVLINAIVAEIEAEEGTKQQNAARPTKIEKESQSFAEPSARAQKGAGYE
jgi:anti-anti-sigma regulatory factor